MKLSIRRFLLINLLLAIAATSCITIIGNYYLDRKNIQQHLDELMAITALSYQALVSDHLKTKSLSSIQTAINQIPKQLSTYYPLNHFSHFAAHNDLNKYSFRVLENQTPLLYSLDAPHLLLPTNSTGFSDQIYNHQKWRVFRTFNPENKLSIEIAERYALRDELGQHISLNDFYLLLLTFPLFGLVIWLIIGTGLRSLTRVAEEVANRAPSHLEPVNIKALPKEVKPVIDELNKLFYRLKEGFEREKRFAADAAHELRTPLAALKAQAQVALNTTNIIEKNHALEKVLASVNRSTHIVQQLLTMSQLASAEATMEFKRVNLIKITREILAMLAPAAMEKNIELEFNCDKNIRYFSGNATTIGILIRNLVDNAIRYCDQNGQVIVRVFQLQEEVVLEVSDNGPGIPLEVQSRVFERFFRVLGNQSPGSGLGLAIVQQIADLHQARVILEVPIQHQGLIVKVLFH